MNVSSVTKHFATASEGLPITLSGTITSGATTVPLSSVSQYANGDVVCLVVDPDNSKKQVFTGTVNTGTSSITGVVWTEGTNTIHNNGATVVDYVTATHQSMMTKGLLRSHNQDGSLKHVFDVTSLTYGAVGDGTTDDSTAIQAAITAATAAGGGKVFFPGGKTYKMTTGVTITPATRMIQLEGYGATLDYSGSGDAITISTNIGSSDDQYAEKSVHIEGLYIKGTSSATSAIRNKASFTTLRNLVIEGFTSTTSQNASIVMDAMFHYWVEECHLENIDIKNTGNGICFISRDDSGGTAASIANNSYTNIHIWLTQAAGRGIYGVGLGATTIVQVARSVFSNIIIHFVNVANLIGFDLRKTYVEGTVFLAPGIDVFGTAATSTGWNYTFSEIVTILGPTFFPLASVTTPFTGGGKMFITGGNIPSTLSTTTTGDIAAPSINLFNDINDVNGNEYFDLASSASAVNQFRVTNAATANWPTLSASGDDTHIGMYIFPKGSSGQVILADHNVNEVLKMGLGTASAVNEVTITNAATGNKPSIAASGGDTNAGLAIDGKGTGAVTLGATSTGNIEAVRKLNVMSTTATPAGGTTGAGIQFGTTSNLGIFFGSGAPTLSAAQGSLYLRTDGSTTATRLYVNTNGTTGWTNVTTAT